MSSAQTVSLQFSIAPPYVESSPVVCILAPIHLGIWHLGSRTPVALASRHYRHRIPLQKSSTSPRRPSPCRSLLCRGCLQQAIRYHHFRCQRQRLLPSPHISCRIARGTFLQNRQRGCDAFLPTGTRVYPSTACHRAQLYRRKRARLRVDTYGDGSWDHSRGRLEKHGHGDEE